MNLRKNAPADGVVVDEAGEQASRKKLFVAGGVAAALAVVAAMGYVFLTGGDDTAADTGVVASAHHPAATATVAPTGTATSAPPIKKFDGSNARDPFKALVEEAAGTGAATAGSTNAATAGSTGTTAPANVPSSTSTHSVSVPSSSPTKTSKPAPQVKSIKISMIAVSDGDTQARIKVDDKTYDVKPLNQFASYFKLLNLREGTCGAIQYGDATFDLCEGQSRLVR
ncbi:hypothetical protein GCM10027446_25020 [Angustibacter peucedani]